MVLLDGRVLRVGNNFNYVRHLLSHFIYDTDDSPDTATQSCVGK